MPDPLYRELTLDPDDREIKMASDDRDLTFDPDIREISIGSDE